MRENNIDDYVSKSEEKAIRAAIRKIENPAQIEAIARADKLSCARSAALELIKDERLLADILINERNEAVFEGAAARIKDQLLLAEIVLNAKTFVPMTKVLSRIDDQDILFRIACEAGNGVCRKLAAARLDSEEALIRMLKSHAEASVRANIVEIIVDQSLIAETALRDPDHTVRESAVERLTDQGVLAGIALKDPNEWVRYKAVRKLTDQSVLAEIIKAEPEAHIRKEAVRILTDEKLLRSLALGDAGSDGDGKSSGKRDESYDVRIIANLKRYNLEINAYTEHTLTRKLIEVTQEPAVLRDIAQNAAYEISFAALVKLSGIASGQGQLPETYSGRNLSLERQLSIIESANDESLRQAVLIKFAKIKTPREALVYRIRAAKLIYDPVEKEYAMKGVMKEIVLTDNANEAHNLLNELADQESFAYLALNAKHPFMRKLAAEKLTDQALLKHVFAAGDGPVQRIVLSRITDE